MRPNNVINKLRTLVQYLQDRVAKEAFSRFLKLITRTPEAMIQVNGYHPVSPVRPIMVVFDGIDRFFRRVLLPFPGLPKIQ